MAQDYWLADEVEKIMREYRKYHADLIGAKIACIYREKASKSDGQPIVGKISRCPSRYHPLMDEPYDYIIEIGADAWSELNNSQKEAWVDYLMEHAYGEESETTGDMTWKLRKPELMAFPSIINRHGINWMPGLPKLATLNLNQATPQPPTRRGADTQEEEEDSFDDLTADIT